MKKIIAILAICIIFHFYGSAQPQRVEIPGSQVRTIISSIVNQEYKLQLFFPSGYANSTKKFPVLYLLDSQWDFPLLTSLYGEQYFDGFIPEMIIAGITWGGTNPNPDSLRARDYTPTNEKRAPQSGGAANFLSFLKKELIPFIETNYKADPNDRILMGCSLGGLFTLYALFTDTELFQRYVATSPAFGWDKEVIYQYEKSYFEKNPISAAKLYMTMGGVERGLPGFERLAKFLADRHYKSLQIKTRVLENTGHSGNKAEGYARGLQYVYERLSLKLNPEVLNKYTGNYDAGNGGKIAIKSEENGLAIYFGDNNKYILHAASENDFYSTSEFLNISFKKENESITGFELKRYGGTQFVARHK